jgi:hypothetical protein
MNVNPSTRPRRESRKYPRILTGNLQQVAKLLTLFAAGLRQAVSFPE